LQWSGRTSPRGGSRRLSILHISMYSFVDGMLLTLFFNTVPSNWAVPLEVCRRGKRLALMAPRALAIGRSRLWPVLVLAIVRVYIPLSHYEHQNKPAPGRGICVRKLPGNIDTGEQENDCPGVRKSSCVANIPLSIIISHRDHPLVCLWAISPPTHGDALLFRWGGIPHYRSIHGIRSSLKA
jgi:hypothetical protein